MDGAGGYIGFWYREYKGNHVDERDDDTERSEEGEFSTQEKAKGKRRRGSETEPDAKKEKKDDDETMLEHAPVVVWDSEGCIGTHHSRIYV